MGGFDPRRALLEWWNDGNRRDLPWRRDRDPYRVLVSEIMLQQTQVDRVVPYFEAFTARFPTFAALAAAPRGDVIRLWGGLGYNQRAVRLHELARVVVEQHGGRLPSDRAGLCKLPGIGPYTAGAVLSIAFGQREAALDTNVRRVVGRYSFRSRPPAAQPGPLRAASGETTSVREGAVLSPAVGPADLEAEARRLLPHDGAGDWNQALMDLGAAVCLRRRPRCLICPLRRGCQSAGMAGRAPSRRQPSTAAPFLGTNRYYRGQLLAQLTVFPSGERAPLSEVAERLTARGVAEPAAGWAAIGHALARDGLIRVEWTDKGVALGID